MCTTVFGAMSQGRWDLFRCPACRGNLHFRVFTSSDDQESGAAQGAPPERADCEQCRITYAIRNGVPRFVSDSGYTTSFGFQWTRHSRAQLDSYSGLEISRSRLFSVTQWSQDLRGQRILEAGSGAGRFTEILLETGAIVYSFDYSEAVDANFANNGQHSNLTLFQGDIFHIPLLPASFDKVICLGVLQHTPEPKRAFLSLAEMVQPGGELVIDVYAKTLAAHLQWKYLLRPITRRTNKDRLYRLVSRWTPRLIPFARFVRSIAGRAGARLVPIIEYSHLGLSPALNREWAILDTFDMYSPAHDHPQSVATVRRWFDAAGFVEISVWRGPNGVVGEGRKR